MHGGFAAVLLPDGAVRPYGNVRAHIHPPLAGKRKVFAQGNCGTALQTTMQLQPGHYTWGVQPINARYEGSPFATGQFTIISTPVTAPHAGQTPNTVQRYNAFGQRTTSRHPGFQLRTQASKAAIPIHQGCPNHPQRRMIQIMLRTTNTFGKKEHFLRNIYPLWSSLLYSFSFNSSPMRYFMS